MGAKSMLGEQFGLLTVIRDGGMVKVSCRCECGNEREVLRANLRRGNSTSCGCKRRATCSARMSKINRRHGMYGTKVYETWNGVVDRCTRPGSHRFGEYGAKGVHLFPGWLDFDAFYAYVGNPPTPLHSIDRMDNARGYEPGNVRWATKKEQAINRCTTRFVSVDGVALSLTDAAVRLGIAKSTASKWLKSGRLTEVVAPPISNGPTR